MHRHGRVGVHKVVVDGTHHLVEDHDRGLGHDDLTESEIDPLPLHRVGDIFLLCYRGIREMQNSKNWASSPDPVITQPLTRDT